MCDIYIQKCDYCERTAEVHIGGFCIPREDVHMICPHCVKRMQTTEYPKRMPAEQEELVAYGIRATHVWWDIIHGTRPILWNKQGRSIGKKGQVVIFYTNSKRKNVANISLNN